MGKYPPVEKEITRISEKQLVFQGFASARFALYDFNLRAVLLGTRPSFDSRLFYKEGEAAQEGQ